MRLSFLLLLLLGLPALAEGCRYRPGDVDLYNSDLVVPLFSRIADPLPAALHRGSAPTQAGLERLKALGIRTILDLRKGEAEGAGQQRKVQRECNLASPHLPLPPAAEAIAAQKLGLTYLTLPMHKSPDPQQTAQFLAWLRDPAIPKPIYLHCQHGRDRSGALLAHYRILIDHWTLEHAVAEMKGYGFLPKTEPDIMAKLTTLRSN